LRAGASGFLLKDTPPADLLAAIRIVAAGDALLAPAVTRRLIAEFARRPEPGQAPAGTLDGVTDRERVVLTLIARGLSNAEIAQALHVTMATAKTHVGRLLAKLGAATGPQLVMVAYETGLVRPGLEVFVPWEGDLVIARRVLIRDCAASPSPRVLEAHCPAWLARTSR
jgi:DNA-binding NarL/FixJ family response regulator